MFLYHEISRVYHTVRAHSHVNRDKGFTAILSYSLKNSHKVLHYVFHTRKFFIFCASDPSKTHTHTHTLWCIRLSEINACPNYYLVYYLSLSVFSLFLRKTNRKMFLEISERENISEYITNVVRHRVKTMQFR